MRIQRTVTEVRCTVTEERLRLRLFDQKVGDLVVTVVAELLLALELVDSLLEHLLLPLDLASGGLAPAEAGGGGGGAGSRTVWVLDEPLAVLALDALLVVAHTGLELLLGEVSGGDVPGEDVRADDDHETDRLLRVHVDNGADDIAHGAGNVVHGGESVGV